MTVTEDEAERLEAASRGNEMFDQWFEYRQGRITASKMGKVCNKAIRQPDPLFDILQMSDFNSENDEGCAWGKSHEEDALREYEKIMREGHTGFKFTRSGLVINPKYPHLGATPYGIVECDCHDKGVLLIKCPYKHRGTAPCQVGHNYFCLVPHQKTTPVCSSKLSKKHNFYYQAQGLMAVCKVSYCDFVCWTSRGVHVERMEFNQPFWFQMSKQLKEYFLSRVLPQLLKTNFARA
nr:hypothetical protein BaRGS_007255 [Batillaria attramentaria]